MIGVLAIGRLGNQLFQYMFALELSNRLQTNFYIKDENHLHVFYADKYFKLKGFNRFKNHLREFRNQKPPLIKIGSDEDVETYFQKSFDSHLYHGFYQSVEYAPRFYPDVHSIIQPKKWILKRFKKKYQGFLNNRTIVIHVRGTDYKAIENYQLDKEYYTKALNCTSSLSDYEVYLVTDDFGHAKNLLPEGLDYEYDRGTEIDDFLKIMHANVAIIANSSFSWWAAYLNREQDKKIIAPKRWLGTYDDPFPNGILDKTHFTLI